MRGVLRFSAGLATLLVLWQLAALVVDRGLLPPPGETLRALVLGFSGDTLAAAGQTAWKAVAALALAMAVGMPIGFLMGRLDLAYDLVRPSLMVIQTVPVVSWLSLVILAWGIGWRGPVFLTFLAVLPVCVLTTVAGVRGLDRSLLEMAHLYRVPRWRVLRDIYLGSLMPFTLAILDVGVGQAWKAILVAEYLCGDGGLGAQILTARMNIDFLGVWSLTLLAVCLGLAAERLLVGGARRALAPWSAC